MVGRVRRVVRRAKRRRTSPAPGPAPVILMYHRVASPRIDPWGLCVSPEHFNAQIERIARRLVATMDDVVDRPDEVTGQERVVVTLDDAYTDTVDHVLPSLGRHQVPCTVYVMTAGIDADRSCWWDRLADLVVGAPAEVTDRLRDHDLVGDIADLDEIDPLEALHLGLWRTLLERDPAGRHEAIATIEAVAGRRASPDSELLDRHGVEVLAAADLVTIGAHTVTHPALPLLSEPERRDEISRSASTLADITGEQVRHFAYPYGRYDDATVATACELGFASAVTTDPDRVSPRPDLHRLPRVQVPDLDGDRFDRWLDSVFAGASP